MTPRNDHAAEDLKAALDAFAAAESEADRRLRVKTQAAAEYFQYFTVVDKARDRARELLRRAGGTVVHNEEFWRLEGQGLKHETVRINLDAADQLRLTPPPSERAA